MYDVIAFHDGVFTGAMLYHSIIINNGKSFRLKGKRKAGLLPNPSKRPTNNYRAARNGPDK